MADLTRTEMIDRVLQHLGVLGAGQSARAEDADLVGEALDATHARLRTIGLAPFATSAIPEWAQVPFRDIIAGDVGRSFGFGDSMKGQAMAGEKEMARQCSSGRQPIRIKAQYF